MNDYERIASVIDHLGENFREQPGLETLAGLTGLSPSHFHRMFRRWAGTTPKSFVQHLTAAEARRLLQGGASVLDTAFDVGLSGPGRLHDLCVNLEAASPGEIKSGGDGWKIQAGFCQTPFGSALIATGPRGICKLAFVADSASRKAEWTSLQRIWPNAKLLRDDDEAEAAAKNIFVSDRKRSSAKSIDLIVKGTAFQHKVWRALLEIPFAEIRSYGELAEIIGNPKGARAVGSAVGSNPIAFLIPCHRVIHASGTVGNYRWGTTRKKALLAWERCGSRLAGC